MSTRAEWTILKLLDWTAAYFAEHGVPSPRLDAELLLSEVLNLKRIDLYLNFEKSVAAADLVRFKSLVQRRARREPLQYILGHADFFGRRFTVTPAVLIPRPDTEQLVARALDWLDAHPSATRVLDFGTGSGCIAITLALERPHLHVSAVDASPAALEVALKNTDKLGASLDFATGPAAEAPQLLDSANSASLLRIPAKPGFDAASPSISHENKSATELGCWRKWGPRSASPVDNPFYNLIISNPPYIPSADIAALQPEVARFEPHLALDGGEDGLAFYRRLLQDAPATLAAGGALIVEIGLGQRAAIEEIAMGLGMWQAATCHKDLSGAERILIFERNE